MHLVQQNFNDPVINSIASSVAKGKLVGKNYELKLNESTIPNYEKSVMTYIADKIQAGYDYGFSPDWELNLKQL